jgi:hypothetical protein
MRLRYFGRKRDICADYTAIESPGDAGSAFRWCLHPVDLLKYTTYGSSADQVCLYAFLKQEVLNRLYNVVESGLPPTFRP